MGARRSALTGIAATAMLAACAGGTTTGHGPPAPAPTASTIVRVVHGCRIEPRTACPGANLRYVDLSGAILTGANLVGANMWGVGLTGANVTGTNMSDANLTNAMLTGADLTAADLSDANLLHATLSGATLAGADLTDAILLNADLSGARLDGARLDGATWTDGRICAEDSRGTCLPTRAEAASRTLPPGR